MISLTKVRDRVYCLRVTNEFELAMICLRVSESFESPNARFRKPFTLAEYMAWYAKHQSENNAFTYPADWSGWNIRTDEIKAVYDAGVSDMNHYDHLMMGIYGMIAADTTEPAYMIAVPATSGDTSLDEHELTHAMYYIDTEYQAKCKELLAQLPSELVEQMRKAIRDGGYSGEATDDEIQAYVSTGEMDFFDDISDPLLDVFRIEQKKIHHEHYSKFLPVAQPERAPLCEGGGSTFESCLGGQAGNAGSSPDRLPQGPENDAAPDQRKQS